MSTQPSPATFHGALDVALDLPLADAGSRALAQALDLSILSLIIGLIVGGGIAVAAALGLGSSMDFETVLAVTLAGILVLMFLAQWGYFVASEMWMEGQSPGKVVMGLRVVTRDGATVTLVPSLIRNVLRIVDLFPSTYSVGLVVMLFNRRGQRLGDLAAGTVVVRELPTRSGPRPSRFPVGASPEDIALIEDFVARGPSLADTRRRGLAMGMVAWLDSNFPGFLAPASEGEEEEARLIEALALEGVEHG